MKKTVETIRGYHTSEETIETSKKFLAQMGKDCIIVNDASGFVANRLSHLFMNEAANPVMENVAQPKDIDEIFKNGKIGLMLIECHENVWMIKLLLMSCRVMSRGVDSVMINYIRNEARKQRFLLQAEFIANDRNRMMYMTYKFAHFKEKEKINERIILENDLSQTQDFPKYLKVHGEFC